MEAYPAQLKVVLMLFFLVNSVLTQQVLPPLISDSERSALLNLRSSLGIRAKYWPRKAANPCSGWTGVECRNGRVVGINLSGLSRTRSGRRNPRFAVDSLAKFTLLSKFNSSGFSLPGPIPDWFGQSLSALQVLDLRSSSITGPIPSALGNLSGLNSLFLSGNSLTGAIPSTLGQLSSLSALNLSGNSLTGGIPPAFAALGNLSTLDLSSNFLSGPIPPALGSLSSLQFLNLYNNSLDASIPPHLGDLSQLIELDLGSNDFSGSLPEYLGRLRSLQKILVGNNRLEGSLPSRLFSNLTQLQCLVLSWNNFDGNLPDVLWSMPRLRLLDVSGNNLTGVLPNLYSSSNVTGAIFNLSNNMFRGTLTSLIRNFQFIDLSNNYFRGPAPSNVGTSVNVTGNCMQNLLNQRSLQDCMLFYTRRGLTFDNGIAPYPTLAPLPEPASNSKKRVTYIVVGLFGGLGFVVLLVLMLLLFLKSCDEGNTDQRTRSVGPVPVGRSPPPKASISLSGLGESFTYEHMLRATVDFSEANLIKHGHSGDLFRGTLEGGFPVVIKRVDLRSFKKEAYMLELEFFSKASHPRLVPLLGHCLEHEYDKFLVYKYLPHGDLSNSLYNFTNLEDDSLQSLDWITRLKIAIGAAEGLSYLHHECNPPLVHREIQASSILLDDKYEVRLGSLSDLCVQEGEHHQNVITRLLRMPQSYEQSSSGSSSATCAYDVYCFGKVLLGLVTGKLGISKTDDANTKEWLEQNLPFISICEKEMVSKIVDKSLIVDEDLLEEVWAMAIVAKSCLHPKPWRRPLMRHILRALENPLKLVREESYSSARLRTTSSRRSWSAAFFGSWRQSSSESAGVPVQTNREGTTTSGWKQAGRVCSQGSGANEISSSHKRSSSEIFPEPVDDIQDIERQEQK